MSQEAVSKVMSALVGSCALVPCLAKGLIDKGWRLTLAERCGGGAWSEICRDLGVGASWFHAASVGEVGGLQPIIEALNEQELLVNRFITTTSLTGREEVLRRKLCNYSLTLPFDQPYIIQKVVSKLRPSICIINETEIWPNFLFALRKARVPVVIVNGRISDRSYPWYQKGRYFLEPVFSALHYVMAQTELDAKRFKALGVPSDRVEVTGSTKYDRARTEFSSEELSSYAGELGLLSSKPIFVGGSVRPEEDEMVIDAYKNLCNFIPETQLILAPRHPQEFERVAKVLREKKLSFNKRSDGKAKTQAPVVLLDTVGELSKVYALATVSFVGGSIVNFGGHNPLEPAAYGSPVLMGKYYSNVREVVEDFKKVKALINVNSVDDITSSLLALLQNKELLRSSGDAAMSVWKKHQGATNRVVSILKRYVL